MWGKHTELWVIGGVMVAEEKNRRALLYLLLQKPLNVGDDAACPLTTVEGITLLEKAPQHIDY
jgi:hypothetical protein